MLKHDVARLKELFDAVQFKQPALQKEKPEKDVDVEDCGGEPVDFHKKPDEKQGLEKVDIRDTKISDVVDELSLEGVEKEQLKTALESKAISDTLPDMGKMFDAIVDSGNVRPNSECSKVIFKGLVNPEHNQRDVIKNYLRFVVIPNVK